MLRHHSPCMGCHVASRRRRCAAVCVASWRVVVSDKALLPNWEVAVLLFASRCFRFRRLALFFSFLWAFASPSLLLSSFFFTIDTSSARRLLSFPLALAHLSACVSTSHCFFYHFLIIADVPMAPVQSKPGSVWGTPLRVSSCMCCVRTHVLEYSRSLGRVAGAAGAFDPLKDMEFPCPRTGGRNKTGTSVSCDQCLTRHKLCEKVGCAGAPPAFRHAGRCVSLR